MSNEETSLEKVSEWGSFLTERADQIGEMLFQPEMATRLTKLMLTAMSRNPVLMHCTKESILYAVIEMGQLNLEPGALGECYVVPFYNNKLYPPKHEAQMMPGYRGLVKLARNSGTISNVTAEPVYENDEFSYQLGLHPDLVHKPLLCVNEEERGALEFFYAIAWPLGDSQPIFEVMTIEQVEAIRSRSKAKNSGPWVSDYNEMGRKTVVKRITKKLPLSPELASAVALDNALEAGLDARLATLHPMFGGAPEPLVEVKEPKSKQVIDMLDGIDVPDVPEPADEKPTDDPESAEGEKVDIWDRADDREATMPQIEALRQAWGELCVARKVKKAGEQEGLLLTFLKVESFEEVSGLTAKTTVASFITDGPNVLDWIESQVAEAE